MTTTSVPATTTAAASHRRTLSVGCAWAAAGCLALPAAANTAYHLLTPVNSGTTAGAVAQAAADPALAEVATLQSASPVLAMGRGRAACAPRRSRRGWPQCPDFLGGASCSAGWLAA